MTINEKEKAASEKASASLSKDFFEVYSKENTELKVIINRVVSVI